MKLIFILSLVFSTITILYLQFFTQKTHSYLKTPLMSSKPGPSLELIQDIFERLEQTKYQGSRGDRFYYQKGLYESYVKLNEVTESPKKNLFGEIVSLPDNNMFVTNFVAYALILSKNLGTIDFEESYIEDSIDAILTYRNKNTEEGEPNYVFWPQYEEDGYWVCKPDNFFIARDFLESLPKIVQHYFKKWFGISVEFIDRFISIFKIPADNDDTGTNLILGSLINQNQDQYPNIAQKWNDVNYNYAELYKNIKKNIYKPFDEKNSNLNSIDSRSFFYMQGFFNKTMEESKKSGVKPDISIFTTWITNIQDQDFDYVQMPYYVNNIDVTVNANALFGLASFLLTSKDIDAIEEIYDEEIRKLINDVTDFLVWAIESQIILERPDLALTYYPSIYDFYWFIARNYKFLNQYNNIQFPELETCKEKFESVLNNHVYQQLVEQMIIDADGNIYWESFLGNQYEDKKQHTDRAFSTSMVLNTLLDIFTEPTSDNKLKYSKNTPEKAKEIINNSINYLSEIMKDKKTPLGNTFFSGSVKTWEQFPYWYPANTNYNYNFKTGEKETVNPAEPKNNQDNQNKNNDILNNIINDEEDSTVYISAVEGYIPAAEYQTMVYNYTWWGVDTPTSFGGFNQMGTIFPYWTSDSITLAYSMLAFSKYLNIE